MINEVEDIEEIDGDNNDINKDDNNTNTNKIRKARAPISSLTNMFQEVAPVLIENDNIEVENPSENSFENSSENPLESSEITELLTKKLVTRRNSNKRGKPPKLKNTAATSTIVTDIMKEIHENNKEEK